MRNWSRSSRSGHSDEHLFDHRGIIRISDREKLGDAALAAAEARFKELIGTGFTAVARKPGARSELIPYVRSVR
jgi:hypothetical protein